MITVLALLPVLFILAAVTINLAYIQYIQTRVQITTDAATRAAGRAYVETGSETDALAAARQLAALNPVQSSIVPIEPTDLEYGVSQRTAKNKAYTFTAEPNGNAVRLSTSAFASGTGAALEPFFPGLVTNVEIRPLCTATNSQTTLDVVLVADRSGSMAYAANEPSGSGNDPAAAPSGWSFGDPVPPQSRWLDLSAAVNGFCNVLSGTGVTEKVALVTYATDVTTDEELTDDYSKVEDEIDDISDDFDGGKTSVGDGIYAAIDAATDPSKSRPWATRTIVLMSDGNHNNGTDPIEAATEAAAQQIPIYTVSFSDEADQTLMMDIANITGGTHYHAINAAELNAAFENIARRLPSMLTQ